MTASSRKTACRCAWNTGLPATQRGRPARSRLNRPGAACAAQRGSITMETAIWQRDGQEDLTLAGCTDVDLGVSDGLPIDYEGLWRRVAEGEAAAPVG